MFAVFGDIHGCYNTLRKLYSKIKKIYGEINFYSVGDLTDRGNFSREVIQFCIDNSILSVKGNHEDSLLNVIDIYKKNAFARNNYISIYYNDGGNNTQLSYVKSQCKEDFGKFIISLENSNHFEYINSLPLKIELDKFIISHAGLIRNGDEQSILWNRSIPMKMKKTQIFGHTPAHEPDFVGNYFFNLDTGCVYGNKLTAGIFNDKPGSFIEFIDEPVNEKDGGLDIL